MADRVPGDGKSTRRRIYLVRHGAVSYFDPTGRPVRPDTVPLNAEGRRQAATTAAALADIPFDRAVASDLPRCAETARIIVGRRELVIEPESRLREIQPGKWLHWEPSSIEAAFVGAFASELSRETQFLGGETFGSLVDRVLPCFGELLADLSWRHLLIVAHGGVNRVILTRALGSGLGAFGAIEQDAACLNVIDVDDASRFILRMMNFTAYNPAKQGLEATTMERLYAEYQRLMSARPVQR